LRALIARTKAAPSIYKSIEGERIPTVIEIDNETSEDRSVIDVQTEDRVGLLYDLSNALAALQVDLSLANILTEKGAAIDSFYATEQNGGKILNPDRITAIQHKLRQAVALSA
jgi:[protein-PII] uridylyltransferase